MASFEQYLMTQDGYRRIFVAAYGLGPHRCWWCGDWIRPIDGTVDRGSADIHHLDGSGQTAVPNNELANLAPVHKSCHGTITNRGRPKSAETCAKISEAHRGKKRPKISAALKGRKLPPETRAKISVALKGREGRPQSAETKAKQSAAMTGRKLTPEHRAKIGAVNKGRTRSAETLAKMSSAQKGHPVSAETRAKISAAQRERLARARVPEGQLLIWEDPKINQSPRT